MDTIIVDIQHDVKALLGLLLGHRGIHTSLFTSSTRSRVESEINDLVGNCLDEACCWCDCVEEIFGDVCVDIELDTESKGRKYQIRIKITSHPLDNPSSKLHVEIYPIELKIGLPDNNEKNENLFDNNVVKIRLKNSGNSYKFMDRPLKSNEIDWMTIHDEILLLLWGPADEMFTLEILRCQQSILYGSRMKKLLPEAEFVQLTSKFIEWLGQDGFVLNSDKESDHRIFGVSNWDNGESSLDLESLSDDEEDEYQKTEGFMNIKNDIKVGLKKLGGDGFIKLNWSSPKDAKWILGGRLICNSSKDVFLLLKSSAWIAHDIDKAFSKAVDQSLLNYQSISYHLCIKRPLEIKEGMEFRCFFWKKRLLGISQRDVNISFEFLIDENFRRNILSLILKFFKFIFLPNFESLEVTSNHLKPTNASQSQFRIPISRGAFDVYFSKRCEDSPLRCKLLDVAPWGSTTDPLLFDWNELRDKAWELVKDCDDEIMIEFRYVKPEMIGKLVNQEAYQRFPQDVLDVFNGSDFNIENLESFLREQEPWNGI